MSLISRSFIVLVAACSLAMGGRPLDIWKVMPDNVESWFAEQRLKVMFESKQWQAFREKADSLLDAGVNGERARYLRLLMTYVGDVRPGVKWETDTAEVWRRISLLTQAEITTPKTPQEHQFLGLVYFRLALMYSILDDPVAYLLVQKKLIEEYYDVKIAEDVPQYWATLGNALALENFFKDAGISDSDAAVYLEGLSKNHPIREFRLAALLSLGYVNLRQGNLTMAQSIVRTAEAAYADLVESRDFKYSLRGLKDVINGKAHLQKGDKGGCCGHR